MTSKKVGKITISKTVGRKKSVLDGGVGEDDAVEKEDFSGVSSDEESSAGEEKEVEDEDTLKNADYGDEEGKEGEIFDEGEEAFAEDDTCVYKFAKKNMSESDEEDDEDIFEDDEIEPTRAIDQIVPAEERETKPVLTKYERVRILGDRAKQLSLGAKPMLLNVDNMNPKEIAKLELERGVIPFIIEKTLPDGRRERWKVSELAIVN
ncbi:MAG: DNA-directed RNA polymerase subunit 6 [Harvfovirus sp.]|uniref:DNA-directed RNA polymerase subunit 6 n=1 Tax=Harvfovirus sp. TaxID=2487768 RepID=A0A3G5A1U5_9VIRU|nr:MAG: DNA-directed RNA polymerase subunit 6 [Harvfovirus sp.]